MPARKTSKTPTRIWSFHARPSIDAVSPADVRWTERCDPGNRRHPQPYVALLQRQNDYYNRLVELERERVARYQAVRNEHAPEIAALQAQLDAVLATTGDGRKERIAQLSGALKAAKKAFESTLAPAREAFEERTSGAPITLLVRIRVMRQDLAGAKVAKDRAAQARLDADIKKAMEEKRSYAHPPRVKERINAEVTAEMLEEDWPESWKALTRAERDAHDACLKARENSGLPWGTYLLTEMAVQAAIKKVRENGDGLPNFRRFSGGRIGVQLSPGISVGETFGCQDSKLRIWYDPKDTRANRRCAFVQVRVGSNPDRSPIFATFPCYLHRKLPDDALIKWAWIKVRRCYGRWRYDLQLTLEAASFNQPRRQKGTGKVTLCPTLARVHDGIMVAQWAGDDGKQGSIVVDDKSLRRLTFPAKLLGYADTHRNQVYRVLRLWCRMTGNNLTGWTRCTSERRRETIKEWCRQWAEYHAPQMGRVLAWKAWKEERLRAGEDLFCPLHEFSRWASRVFPMASGEQVIALWADTWCRKDTHLRTIQGNCTDSSINARNEHFRMTGIDLYRRYGELETTDEVLNLDEEESDEARALRKLVSPGECRSIIREVFGLPRAPGSATKREQSGDVEKPAGARKSKKKGKKKTQTDTQETA